MRVKRFIAFAVVAAVASFTFTVLAQEGLSREAITRIAVEEAGKIGHPEDKSNVIYDEGNAKWEALSDSMTALYTRNNIPLPSTWQELSGRDYQAVCLEPKYVGATDGTIWIFVDRATGEVISNYFISH
jgi:hypothetical protein